jgi:hypothetical protein
LHWHYIIRWSEVQKNIFLDISLILLRQSHYLVHHLYRELKLSQIITHPGNCTGSIFKDSNEQPHHLQCHEEVSGHASCTICH